LQIAAVAPAAIAAGTMAALTWITAALTWLAMDSPAFFYAVADDLVTCGIGGKCGPNC
jgi:hypothetical protein